MGAERVEFLDGPAAGGAGSDVIERTGSGSGGGPRWWWALIVVVVVAAGLLVASLGHRDDTPPVAAATRASAPTTPLFGLIATPRSIGTPRRLVTAHVGDVVWLLDRGAGIVRIDGGRVTGVQLLEAQATAIAASPDGRTLYAATAGDAPALQVLDGRTLALGRSLPLPFDVQGIAVSADAVWAAAGGRVLRLGLGDLIQLGEIALPGVVTIDHLRVDFDPSGDEQLTALVTTDVAGARLLRVDVATGAIVLGPPLPGSVSVATGQLLTWVSWTPPGSTINTTEGFGGPGAPAAVASTTTVLANSRIYDGGLGAPAFFVVQGTSHVVGCRDAGGFATSEIDVGATVPGATVTGDVVSTGTALYVVTDRGVVRTGVGSCG